MHELIADVAILKDEVDVVVWLLEKHENFSVKLGHDVLNFRSAVASIKKEMRIVVNFMWRIPAPTNVLLFG